jgi:site-specific DNA recombinase
MKATIYTRVSSKEQAEEGYSLEAQAKLLKEYAKKNGLEVDSRIFSISESASGKKQRETFIEMLEYVNKNNLKIIICEKADRFTRNFKDMVMIDDWLEADEFRQIHLVKDSLILHKNSKSQEKLNWGIRILFAKNYIDNLSEEVQKGQKEKLSQGWLPTKPPLGYSTIGDKGRKTHIINDSKAKLILSMFELYSTRLFSLKTLVERMFDLGLRTGGGNKLVKSRMASLLSDPFYYGEILWNGKIYPGNQHPIISKELFDNVQNVLHGKTQIKHNKHLFTFKGFIRCQDCNGLVTWETKKGHVYGHCNKYNNCPKRDWYKDSLLVEQLLPAFQKLKVSNPRLQEWIKKALKESYSTTQDVIKASIEEASNRLVVIQTRLDKLYDDKLDEKVTIETYDRKFKEYTTEKQSLLNTIGHGSKESDDHQQLGAMIFDVSQKAEDLFLRANTSQKRKLINFALCNMKIKNGLISYEYTKPFQILFDSVAKTNQLAISTIELDEKPMDKKKSTAFEAVRSSWLCGRVTVSRLGSLSSD